MTSFTSSLSYLVQCSHSVMSDSLRPRGLQQARLPCPWLYPQVCLHSCPLSRWCYLTISSSTAPFFLLSIFPSIRVFSSWRENQLLRAGPIGHHKSHRFSQLGTYRPLSLPAYPNRILEIFQDHWIIVHSFSSFGVRRHFLMLLFYF